MSNGEGALEILSVSLLDEHRTVVSRLQRLAAQLRIGLGWHYLLDMAWILARLGPSPGKVILDAGAGLGLMQWFLCEEGATVLSVDRASRASLPMRFRARYPVRGLREADLEPARVVLMNELRGDAMPIRSVARQVRNLAEFARRPLRRRHGEVIVYNRNLREMTDIKTESVDTVVSVSSLEHNPPDELPEVVGELIRVLRPGGRLLATLGAAAESDWYHLPSQGWCYTEGTLRRIFGIPPGIQSNYESYERLFANLRACSELRDHLASFYFRSGSNGMPWGIWAPMYQPVGVMVSKTVGSASSVHC